MNIPPGYTDIELREVHGPGFIDHPPGKDLLCTLSRGEMETIFEDIPNPDVPGCTLSVTKERPVNKAYLVFGTPDTSRYDGGLEAMRRRTDDLVEQVGELSKELDEASKNLGVALDQRDEAQMKAERLEAERSSWADQKTEAIIARDMAQANLKDAVADANREYRRAEDEVEKNRILAINLEEAEAKAGHNAKLYNNLMNSSAEQVLKLEREVADIKKGWSNDTWQTNIKLDEAMQSVGVMEDQHAKDIEYMQELEDENANLINDNTSLIEGNKGIEKRATEAEFNAEITRLESDLKSDEIRQLKKDIVSLNDLCDQQRKSKAALRVEDLEYQLKRSEAELRGAEGWKDKLKQERDVFHGEILSLRAFFGDKVVDDAVHGGLTQLEKGRGPEAMLAADAGKIDITDAPLWGDSSLEDAAKMLDIDLEEIHKIHFEEMKALEAQSSKSLSPLTDDELLKAIQEASKSLRATDPW